MFCTCWCQVVIITPKIQTVQVTEGPMFKLFPIINCKIQNVKVFIWFFWLECKTFLLNHFLWKVTLFDLWLVLTLSYSAITLCLPVNVSVCVFVLSVLYLCVFVRESSVRVCCTVLDLHFYYSILSLLLEAKKRPIIIKCMFFCVTMSKTWFW